ncbi:DUF4920 domain-containing protein [Corallococcus macrosporus]|uniref:DUF4920 domain-containing protein n=2 Tax=Myxococcaceae TaxID=31 RepID=A0A250JQW4_9BACT|nr:DUF4920 domain-containing protein [Corallococcus macrosporus]AEI62223.1 hypothetical protein LILAB_01460 [Corallococcus macrosporus]ATB45872.1 hypothetical protein MYMAC_001457 [Corallococcus macrosporus DSM 14697]
MNTLRTSLMLLVAVPLVALAGDKTSAKAGKAAEADCHHPPAPQAAAKSEATPAAAADTGWKLTRGEPLKGAKAVKLADVLARPQAHDGKTVLLEGQVRKACERKGCWMELAASGQDKGPGVRVTFKDYGFFVPLDSAGSQARVEGVLKVAELSDSRAQHYESEGAIVPRGADGKPREVQLVATGVELRR